MQPEHSRQGNPLVFMSQDPNLDATIAVCTRDRPGQLEQLFRSLCRLDTDPNTDWEVLVVDNGSTGATRNLVGQYRDSLPIRCVSEPRQGLSHARNRAISDAKGNLILFTDDDCVVPSDWLARLLAAASRYHLADLFAGEIEPYFEGVDDAWSAAARKEAPSAFARFEFGGQDIRIDHRSDLGFIPYGANFAVRTAAAKKFSFDPMLGRGGSGSLLLGGEETRFLLSMLNSGHVGWLVAGSPVEHRIPAQRATLEYITQYYYGVGLQWGLPPASSGWKNALRRLALGVLCRLAPHLQAPRDPGVMVARLRDWNMARGALNSHKLDERTRMVNSKGNTVF